QSMYVHALATPPLFILSLHDALPILLISAAWETARTMVRTQILRWLSSGKKSLRPAADCGIASPRWKLDCGFPGWHRLRRAGGKDRKSTRLNSSHEWRSYAVFCLKQK